MKLFIKQARIHYKRFIVQKFQACYTNVKSYNVERRYGKIANNAQLKEEVENLESIEHTSYNIRAYQVGTNTSLVTLRHHSTFSRLGTIKTDSKRELVFLYQNDGRIIVYPFGCIVFVNVEHDHRQDLIRAAMQHSEFSLDFLKLKRKALSMDVMKSLPRYMTVKECNVKRLLVTCYPGMQESSSIVSMDSLFIQSLEDREEVFSAICRPLALYSAMTTYEQISNGLLQETDDLDIESSSKHFTLFLTARIRDLKMRISTATRLNMKLTSRIKLTPTYAIRSSPEANDLYKQLSAHYELSERIEDLEATIGVASESLRFHIDMLSNEKAERLEIIIVILIALELLVNLPLVHIWIHNLNSLLVYYGSVIMGESFLKYDPVKPLEMHPSHRSNDQTDQL